MFQKFKKRCLSKQIKKFNNNLKYYQKKKELKELKQQYKGKKIPTSKLALSTLLANFFIIEIFTGWATIKAIQIASLTGIMDWTPLVTLIGAIAGSTVSLLGYYAKSAKENSRGGIIYEKAMAQETYYYDDGDAPAAVG